MSIFVSTFLFEAMGVKESLQFDRRLVDEGHYALLLTGHLVHLNWAHWGLNMAGLGLVALFFSAHGRAWHWLGVLLISALFSSLGVYWFNPETITVVGLSAVLHGLFLYGAALETEQDRASGCVLLALLGAKLTWERFGGAMPGSESIVGGHVLTDAHLYGAIGGACAVAIFSRQTLVALLPARLRR